MRKDKTRLAVFWLHFLFHDEDKVEIRKVYEKAYRLGYSDRHVRSILHLLLEKGFIAVYGLGRKRTVCLTEKGKKALYMY